MASVRINNQEVSARDLSRSILTAARVDRRSKAMMRRRMAAVEMREVETELAYMQATKINRRAA